jgi:aminoglycoside 6'-N-acetyltransferase
MNITFQPLVNSHFPLLLKWLETPHVKAWWDQDMRWTPELIEQKYSNYVHGFKRLKLVDQIIEKPMHAYIVLCDKIPIGYIQYYEKHDFPPEQEYEIAELPKNCAAIDWYIGEPSFIGKGIGSKAMSLFLDNYVFPKFDYVFVDPETENIGAIRAYEKAGFREIKRVNDGTIIWMIKEKDNRNYS